LAFLPNLRSHAPVRNGQSQVGFTASLSVQPIDTQLLVDLSYLDPRNCEKLVKALANISLCRGYHNAEADHSQLERRCDTWAKVLRREFLEVVVEMPQRNQRSKYDFEELSRSTKLILAAVS
jgi:hypothetical protein